jgi:hypothetical protein
LSTTDLFVELVVIGTGPVVWLAVLILSVLGYNWIPYDETIALLALLPLLSVAYVLGIVVDRLADSLFGVWDKPLRRSAFPDNAEYRSARTYIYIHATETIIGLFEYGRSRLRISRAWSLNWALLAIGAPILVWTRFRWLPFGTRVAVSIGCFVVCGLGAITTWFVWRKLAVSDYKRLAETYALLREERQDGEELGRLEK